MDASDEFVMNPESVDAQLGDDMVCADIGTPAGT